MNWMTSAKKRIAKASKYRPDHYKRVNAFKKLSRTHKANILQLPTTSAASIKPIRSECHDQRMVADIDHGTHTIGHFESTKIKEKDPFDELYVSSEDEHEYQLNDQSDQYFQFPESKIPKTNNQTLNTDHNKQYKGASVENHSSNTSYFEVMTNPSIVAEKQPIVAMTAEENHPNDVLQVVELWDLFDGDTRVWRDNLKQSMKKDGLVFDEAKGVIKKVDGDDGQQLHDDGKHSHTDKSFVNTLCKTNHTGPSSILLKNPPIQYSSNYESDEEENELHLFDLTS